jgi:hypothetical protein
MANPVPLDDVQRMGKAIAESGLFGIKTPAQAIALMLVAQAEGRHPASAAQDYHIISGRPSLKADAMLGRFLACRGRVEWHELTDAIADATFHHESGGSVRLTWDMARAKAAGLLGNPTWKKYPRAMLRARLVSEGVRTVFPAVLGGMYTPEEVKGFTEQEDTTEAEYEIVQDADGQPEGSGAVSFPQETPDSPEAPRAPALGEDESEEDAVRKARILTHIRQRLNSEFGDGPPWEPREKCAVIKDLFGRGVWREVEDLPVGVLYSATMLDPDTDGDPERTRFERVIRLVKAGVRRGSTDLDASAWPGSEREPVIDAEVF